MKKYSVFALYLFFGEACVRLCGFYANAYLGRTLGPAGYGLIIIGTSLLSYSLLISDAGLRIRGILETAKPEGKRIFAFSDIISVKIFHAFLSFIVLYALTFILYNKTDEHSVRTICIYYLLNIFFDALFLDWYFKGLQRFGVIAAARLFGSLMYVISISLYVKTASDVTKVPLLFFVTNMITVVVLFLVLPKMSFTYKLSFSIRKYISVITHSLPLGIGTLLNQVTVYLPPIILGKWTGVSDSGYYGAALKLVLLIMIIDKTFSTIFLSSLPRIWNNNEENAKKSLQTLLHCTLVLGFFISLLLSSLSEPVISLVFGKEYFHSSTILSIVSWFFTLTMINSIFAFGLIAIDRQKRYLKAAAIGFVINCILITILIRLYGTYGAAVAVVCGELIFILLCYHEFRKFSSLKFYAPFLKACVAGGIAWYLPTVFGDNVYIKSASSVCIFTILSIILQIVTKGDITFLITKWKKN